MSIEGSVSLTKHGREERWVAVWTPEQGREGREDASAGHCESWVHYRQGQEGRVWGEDAIGQPDSSTEGHHTRQGSRRQSTPISLCDVTTTCVYIGMSGRD